MSYILVVVNDNNCTCIFDKCVSIVDVMIADIPTSVMTCMSVTPTTQTAPVGLVVPVEQLVGDVEIPPETVSSSSTDPDCK